MKNPLYIFTISLVLLFSCKGQTEKEITLKPTKVPTEYSEKLGKVEYTTFYEKLADKALSLTQDKVQYDPSYFSIDYPNGDVPKGKGVCTDVVIRAYRKMNIDLQKEVHEDMKANFGQYPKIWGLKKTDTNIDHRRVPNLQKFFSRKGEALSVTNNANDYLPGDLVTWKLGGKLPHIGVVSNLRNKENNRYMIVHNIGAGQVLEDVLFEYPITGHYRYRK